MPLQFSNTAIERLEHPKGSHFTSWIDTSDTPWSAILLKAFILYYLRPFNTWYKRLPIYGFRFSSPLGISKVLHARGAQTSLNIFIKCSIDTMHRQYLLRLVHASFYSLTCGFFFIWLWLHELWTCLSVIPFLISVGLFYFIINDL